MTQKRNVPQTTAIEEAQSMMDGLRNNPDEAVGMDHDNLTWKVQWQLVLTGAPDLAGEFIQITSKNHDYLQPGNLVNLRLSDELLQSKAVHKILQKNGKSAVISLGGREYDIVDAIRAKRDISNAYLAQSLYELTDNATNSGNITIVFRVACSPRMLGFVFLGSTPRYTLTESLS